MLIASGGDVHGHALVQCRRDRPCVSVFLLDFLFAVLFLLSYMMKKSIVSIIPKFLHTLSSFFEEENLMPENKDDIGVVLCLFFCLPKKHSFMHVHLQHLFIHGHLSIPGLLVHPTMLYHNVHAATVEK